MSKISQYLNEHILGEVTNNSSIREAFASDDGILSITPEVIVHPRNTNDIRKVARFSWQLAEKGHILPITVRGGGSSASGASIGKGIIVSTLAHLNNIFFINPKSKDQFVHTQPGIVIDSLNEVLKSHGMIIPIKPKNSAYSTIGSAVSNNISSNLNGELVKFGSLVNKLEIVLANGDLIETGRINRHELNRKKGLQTFEGEIYRKIDGIIDDNKELIDKIATKYANDNLGYSGISKVKNRDGSFDLAPLFIGSQGTLGIISELVIKTDFYNDQESIIAVCFADSAIARTAIQTITKYQPSSIELIDGRLYDLARTFGKKYLFNQADDIKAFETVVVIKFNDFSERLRKRKVRRAIKKLSRFESTILSSVDHPIEDLQAISDIMSVILSAESDKNSTPNIISGSSIPIEKIDNFYTSLDELAKKHHVSLLPIINWQSGIVSLRPEFDLSSTSDRQKIFKLIADYTDEIVKLGGIVFAESGEGRLKTVAYSQIEPEIIDLYAQIRKVFDPFEILNPGVKQKNDVHSITSHISSTQKSSFAKYSPSI